MRPVLAGVLVIVLAMLATTVGKAAAQPAGYEAVLDITFPVSGQVTFGDDYHAWRGGGTRRHQATDIFAPKLALVFAAAAGQVCRITGIDDPVPAHGYQISVCGDDGREYHYVHLNDDRPGTDDSAGGTGWAYAPRLREGERVTRGQWLGFVGDSGNAEQTAPHLHFEIEDARLRDARIAAPPYDPARVNPYPSLAHAYAEGDIAGGVLREGARGQHVVDWQRQLELVGHGVGVDGVFGPQTLAATTAFQEARGIPVDGIVGSQTRDALSRALVAPALTPVSGPGPDVGTGEAPPWPGRLLRIAEPLLRGDDVRRWQQRMRDRGWQLAVDGVYGPESEGVCQRFQREKGLAVDGIVGPATWSATFTAVA